MSHPGYRTEPRTREEFKKFLKWYRDAETGNSIEEDKVLDRYFEEENIALSGIRRLEGAYTRDRKEEGWICFAIFIGAIILTIVLSSFLPHNLNDIPS